jgi:NAD(P)H-flavin reductase
LKNKYEETKVQMEKRKLQKNENNKRLIEMSGLVKSLQGIPVAYNKTAEGNKQLKSSSEIPPDISNYGGNESFRLVDVFDDSLELPKRFSKKNDNSIRWNFSSQGFRANFADKDRDDEINQRFMISKNPTEMKLERIEAFFYNHGMEIALGVLYLSLNLLMAGHGAYQFSKKGGWTTDNDVLRVTLPIARAGGRLVTLNCAILLLTACKFLWTTVRTYVAPVVPIGFPIDDIMPKYHRYVALTVIFSGCVIHTLPQIVNYASRSIVMDHDGMRFWTFGDGFATKQLLLTGTLLAIIFSTFFLTTLKAFRRTAAGFRWFWFFHMGGIATAYPLLLIHGTCRGHPLFLYVALIPLVLYLFDISMRRKNIYSANVLRWRIHDDEGQQITELVLERPDGFTYTPGQYAELKYAHISAREWHPFTIASAPGEGENSNNDIVFYIKNAGRWTGALMEHASAYDLSEAKTPPQMLIRGPHGAPAMNYTDYKHIMVVGSGVGVTPLLSIWKYLVEKGKSLKMSNFRKSSMVTLRQYQQQSMTILDQSMNIFNEQSRSRNFFMSFSGGDDFFASHSIHLGNFDGSFDESKATTKDSINVRATCSLLGKYLESMTVMLSLFILLVLGETATVLLQMAGFSMAANVMGSSLSLIAFLVHGSIVMIWGIGVGWSIYIRLFAFWLDCTIVVIDCFALGFSIKGCVMAKGQKNATSASNTTVPFIIFCFMIAMQAVRIFHLFYKTLKQPTSPTSNSNKKEGSSKTSKTRRSSIVISDKVEFCSVEGILINRKYSNMKFAAKSILPQILKDGLSDVFSMEFYGTREKPKKAEKDEEITEHSLVGRMMGSMGAGIDVRGSVHYNAKENQDDLFCPGRPNWNHIFLNAISRAHATNEEGESVGVFFCGSPAIAKDLVAEARRVTAQHQFAMNHMNGKRCKCKLIVHSENF